ncbi:MAG: hypothetical protein ACR652_12140 [Methylocystis sp.]|uniref:hypothetical protein n=1 Tax=Methylocystis sp. TaxID=1911079 RepID=UPI003DA34EEC
MNRFLLALGIISLSGCAHDPIPFLDGPSPYLVGPNQYMSDEELKRVVAADDLNRAGVLDEALTSAQSRNQVITAKMFVIDHNYNVYESKLGKENEFANLATSIASLGVSTAGATIPVGQTTKVLAAVATGITGSKAAFDRDVLMTRTIQVVETQMRTDRANVAKLLRSRMSCSIDEYPLFMAMSDLDTYRQAGTLEYAMTSLEKLAAKAEADATAKTTSAAGVKVDSDVTTALKALDNAGKAVSALQTACPLSPPKPSSKG